MHWIVHGLPPPPSNCRFFNREKRRFHHPYHMNQKTLKEEDDNSTKMNDFKYILMTLNSPKEMRHINCTV